MKCPTTIIFILSFCSFGDLFSQASTRSGNVHTSSTPVRYASVTFIDNSDTSKKYSTLTDSSGNFKLDVITSVASKPASVVPQEIELAQNYPNPFSTATAISYQLNTQADVNVKIYDILGREVKRFDVGLQTVGTHGVLWDGKNNFGEKVALGVYFYRLTVNDETQVKKMSFTSGTNSINIPLLNRFSFQENVIQKIEKKVIFFGKQYMVCINSIENTQPKISFSEFFDVMIYNDTILNFQVAEEEQWKLLGLENETVTAVAIDPVDTNVIYAGTLYNFSAGIDGKLFKSSNGGVIWDTLLIGGSYRNILIDPSNHKTIYALPGSIIKSEDGGKNWQIIINGIQLSFESRLLSLAINPKNSNVLYAGTGGMYGGNLYRSYDGGLHWNKIASDSLKDGITSIFIDQVDTNNIYVGTAGRGLLWKSIDAGESWYRTSLGGLGIYAIHLNTKTIYAGVYYSGIFKTEDSGINWNKFSQGLPAICNVMKIEESSSARLFSVATFDDNGGIYEYSLVKNKWINIGIDALHASYYYSDLKISSNSSKLYFGGKGGIYVMDLKR